METTYIDGLERIWGSENSRPDESTAGRLIASSRNSIDTSQTRYDYGTRSCVVKEVSRPPKTGRHFTTYRYTVGETVETPHSEGSSSQFPAQATTRNILYLPNPEYSTDKLVKDLVANVNNPLDLNITTTFDGYWKA